MINTSMGYHTFSFFQKLSEEDYFDLSVAFGLYVQKNKDVREFHISNKAEENIGRGYSYKSSKGIRWLMMSSTVNEYNVRGLLVIVDSKALIEGNYIVAAQESDFEKIEKLFNEEAARISHLIKPLGHCSLSRVDPCLNIDLKELKFPCSPEQMMKLVKQGNIPKWYTERSEDYDKKQHRKVTYKNSLYLTCGSVNTNCYWKYPQQDENHPNYSFRELSRDVIRLEVQCKYPKLYSLSKGIKETSKYWVSTDDLPLDEVWEIIVEDNHNPSNPVDVVLKDQILEKIIRKHFYKILRKGDYFTLEGAREIVESYDFRRSKEERMVYALEMVKKHHGIAKAKSKLHGQDLADFKRSLTDLDDILVNPVTIPRRWGIEHIPNLLGAYYDATYVEQLIPEHEYIARQHIVEFLSEATSKQRHCAG